MERANCKDDSTCCEALHDCPCASTQQEPHSCCPGTYPVGTRLRIRELRGGRCITSRLCALGFTPGTTITVCGNGGAQGCRVQVRDTCVVLDTCSATSIVCEPVS